LARDVRCFLTTTRGEGYGSRVVVDENGPVVLGSWKNAFDFCAPRGDGTLGLGGFTEEETEEHVETAESEKEKGGNKGKVVYVVR